MPTVAENLLEVNRGIDKVEELNEELEQTLYGGDTGYRGYYDAFWDKYQNYGNRGDYQYAFAGLGWNDGQFKPKYPLVNITSAAQMFQKSEITNLKKVLEDCGISFDTSNSGAFTQFCQSSNITHLPIIDMRKAANTSYAFAYSKLIELKIIVAETTPWSNTFAGLSNLITLIVEGVIGQNGFAINNSKKLSKASIISVINALSVTTSGLSVTLSEAAVNKAFETSSGLNDGMDSTEWKDLIATRNNWEIKYA